jgi:hypothetical protein
MFATLAVVAIALLVAVIAGAFAGTRDQAVSPAAPAGLRPSEFSSFRL